MSKFLCPLFKNLTTGTYYRVTYIHTTQSMPRVVLPARVRPACTEVLNLCTCTWRLTEPPRLSTAPHSSPWVRGGSVGQGSLVFMNKRMTPLGSNMKAKQFAFFLGSCRFKIITQALYNISPQQPVSCSIKVIDIMVVELKDKI